MLPKFLMSGLDLYSFKEFKYLVKSFDLNNEPNEIKLISFLYCLFANKFTFHPKRFLAMGTTRESA